MVKSKLTPTQLYKNRQLAENYKEGTNASYLIGKDYSMWNRQGTLLMLHELRMIPISKIVKTSEQLKYKTSEYKSLTTQAPPVDVTPLPNKKYRLFNGHRRLKTAISKGQKYIFAEIHHTDPLEI